MNPFETVPFMTSPRIAAVRMLLPLVMALGAWEAVHAAEAAGYVQVVVGSAKLYDAAGMERDIQKGAEIRPGDRIVTGDQSLVQMKLTDGSYVSVRTNTDVALEHYRHDEKSPKESGALLKLVRGALRSITGLIGARNPDGYRIVTPTATIGIRGTDHEPVFIPEPKAGETPMGAPGTYDKVNSGATVIRAASGEINIRPGQVGFVPAAARVPPVILPAVPDFFKKLDPAKERAARRGEQTRAAATETGGERTLRDDTARDGEKRDTPGARIGPAADGDKREPSTADARRGAERGDGDKTSRSSDAARMASSLGGVPDGRFGGNSEPKMMLPTDGGATSRALSPAGTTLTPLSISGGGDRPRLPLSPTTAPLAPLPSPTTTTLSPLRTITPTTTITPPTTTTTTTIINR